MVDWWDTNFRYRIKITVDKDKVGATLTDYPVYVNLDDMPDAFFSHCESDGSDIAVTESTHTTQLDRELVNIDTTGKTGELYFNSGTLSSVTDTDFYIYYGKSGGGESNSTGTWASKYIGVYHFNEAAGADVLDSTSNGNDGTSANCTLRQTGKAGYCYTYNGTTSYVNLGTFSTIKSFTGWIKQTAFVADQTSISFGTTTDAASGYWSILSSDNTNDTLSHQYWDGGGWEREDTGYDTGGTWYYTGFTIDTVSPQTIFYMQGGADTTNGDSPQGSIGNLALYLGKQNAASPHWFTGSIDEVRLYNEVVTPTWISTEWNNFNDTSTFYSVGAEVEGDFTAPSVPKLLHSTSRSYTEIGLAWSPSSDNVAVTGYKVYRDGAEVQDIAGTSVLDTGLSKGTRYMYQVTAYDAFGNESSKSVAKWISTYGYTGSEAQVKRNYPVTSGITATSKHEGRQARLLPSKTTVRHTTGLY